jgi:tetratricopeptide (TPR) repeat protein
LNVAAPAPDAAQPADPSASPIAQARQAFDSGDYANALKLTQQALAQMPNDVTLHEFLALVLFAQGNYDQAAAPLYAVLSAGPGWDWTTLISNYTDANAYTEQLRALEGFVKANPKSSNAAFVLAYHYICQGHPDAAVKPLQTVVALQPNDQLSAHLLSQLQPPSSASESSGQSVDVGKLLGVWVAQAPQNASITLTLTADGAFSWAYAQAGKPPTTISGTFTLSNSGILTLAGNTPQGGPLAGTVTMSDASHLGFKAVGGPANDPGLQFTR